MLKASFNWLMRCFIRERKFASWCLNIHADKQQVGGPRGTSTSWTVGVLRPRRQSIDHSSHCLARSYVQKEYHRRSNHFLQIRISPIWAATQQSSSVCTVMPMNIYKLLSQPSSVDVTLQHVLPPSTSDSTPTFLLRFPTLTLHTQPSLHPLLATHLTQPT